MAGALVMAPAPIRRVAIPSSDTPYVPADFKGDRKTGAVLTALMNQCQASEAAAAIIPWFCDKLASPSSRRDYASDMRKFFSHMAAQGVHPFDVTGDDIRVYKEALAQDGKSENTIARALSVLRGTYEQLGKKGLVAWNIVGDIQAVSAPAVTKNTTPYLEEVDAKRLLHAPDTSTLIGCRDFALLFTYFKTWVRREALAKTTIGSLQPGAEWKIRVTEKRNKKVERLLLEATQPVLDWIQRSGRTLDDKHLPLWPAIGPDKKTVTDRPMAGRTILQMVKKYGQQIGLNVNPTEGRGICTHTLRKSAGVSALKNKADMWQVKEQFGHSSIATTEVYAVASDEDAKEAARRNQIR